MHSSVGHLRDLRPENQFTLRTNLDLWVHEDFGYIFPELPQVGDRIESKLGWGGRHISLRVCNRYFEYNAKDPDRPRIVIELHLDEFRTITEWEQWYRRIQGRAI